MVNVVAIPTRERFELLVPLVHQLLTDDVDLLLILDNSEDQLVDALLPEDRRVVVYRCPTGGIYRMWNLAWEVALAHYPDEPEVNLAILNDDLRVPEHFIAVLATSLRISADVWCVYPDYDLELADVSATFDIVRQSGTYKDGGLSGFAFMIRAEEARAGHYMPFFDESFEVWYGDDDLARNLTILGKSAARVTGLPVEHVGSATLNAHPELSLAIARDVIRWRQKVGPAQE